MKADPKLVRDDAGLLARFEEEVNSKLKIRCTKCGQIALPISVDPTKTARMCMCFGMEWEKPQLDETCELPEQWVWA